ncbi:MAG: hypothetical protein ACMUIA_03850 [bacterium]
MILHKIKKVPLRSWSFGAILLALLLSISRASYPFHSPPVTVVKQVISPAIRAAREKEVDRVPELPTFQAPILQRKRKVLPLKKFFHIPNLLEARRIVQQELADTGILKTLYKIMQNYPNLPYQSHGTANREFLEEIGLPVRLLSCYRSRDQKIPCLDGLIEAFIKHVSGREKQRAELFLRQWEFEYLPTLPGFTLLPENGVFHIDAFRFQLYPPDYTKGEGDGSTLDILRQFLLCTTHEKFLVSMRPANIQPLIKMIQKWKVPAPERIFLLEDSSISSQWAQDNCKTGILYDDHRKFREHATLVPRYASVGEEDSEYRPSESFVFDQVQRAGWQVVQSPLLFQGGNILPVKNPETGELIVFLGQAEIIRNTKLGLTEGEVLKAFHREWGADRIEVLPPLSFHIDLEVSFRWHQGEMIAFVNESLAAARLIVRCGIKALFSCYMLTEGEANTLISWLDQSREQDQLLKILWSKMNEFRDGEGQFVSDKAELFMVSAEESGSLNLSRFLLGLDFLSAAHQDREKFWEKLVTQDAREDLYKYYYLLLEREEQRTLLRKQLLLKGIKVIPLPSMSDDEVSLNYLNAIHDLDAVYLPAFGGIFQEVDNEVLEIVKGSLGHNIKIHLVRNSVTQSQCGGVHCSVSVYARERLSPDTKTETSSSAAVSE